METVEVSRHPDGRRRIYGRFFKSEGVGVFLFSLTEEKNLDLETCGEYNSGK
jgi:hypothetical protein